jgi:type VI secretion system protein ImpH
MNRDQFTSMLLSCLDDDFKAEVVAAEMAEHGIDHDRILVMMLGALKRTHSKDVSSIDEEISNYNHKEYIVVKTPREGIYDMLPQGLFHRPAMLKPGQTETDLIKSIKQRKKEEADARKFFLPFEAAINYLRMQMVLYENRLDKRSHYNDLVNIFADHWEIFKYFHARQANIFLHLIPIIHDVRDDYPVIQTIFEMLLLLPVKIELRRQQPFHPAEPYLSKMGDSLLGVNLTTGNELFDEGADEILISIGPMPKDVRHEFMPGARNYNMLQLLKDYFLPVHLDVVTEYVMDEGDRVMRLMDEESAFNAVLGEDTYL